MFLVGTGALGDYRAVLLYAIISRLEHNRINSEGHY